jgi:hypothetical protein
VKKAADPPKKVEAAPDDKARAADIARWIKELQDERYAVRERASKSLERAGEPAIKPLEEAAKSAELETQRRARQVIDRIENNMAMGATLIRLRLKDVPVTRVVAEFSKQSRIKLEIVPQQGPAHQQLERKQISLDLDRVPFWEALDKLCQAASLAYSPRDAHSLQLHAVEKVQTLPTSAGGAFRVRVTGMNYNRSLSFPGTGQPFASVPGAPTRTESLNVSLDLTAEPHIKVLAVGTPHVLEARDENGQSLALPGGPIGIPNRGMSFYPNPTPQLQTYQAQAGLRPSTKPGTTLKVFKGKIPVEVMSHYKPIVRVENVMTTKKKVVQGREGVTLVLLQIQEQGPQNGTIRFAISGLEKVRNEIQGAGQPGNFEAYRPCFELTDADGRPVNMNLNFNFNAPFFNGQQQAPDLLEGNIYYSPGVNTGPASRFTFFGFRRLQTDVPFEMRDVPMP